MSNGAGPARTMGPPPGPEEFPAGITLITVQAGERRNVMTANRIVCVDPDPMIFAVAVHHDRYSYGLIKESGEFVINCVTKEMAGIAVRAGQESGRDKDKFAAYGLQTKPATKVAAPLIEGCSANIECKVINSFEVAKRTLFIAEMVALHTNEGKLPLVSFQHRFYQMSDPLGPPPQH